MTSRSEDQELVAALLADPNSKWNDFWDSVVKVVHSRVRAFNLSREDTADAISEITFRILKNDLNLLRNWDSTRCSLRGYVAVVATSTTLDFVRGAFHRYNQRKIAPKQENELSETADWIENLEDDDPSPKERLQCLQVEETVTGVIESWNRDGGLKPIDHQLLTLRLTGLSFSEIGKILEISPENATTRFHRLKKEFRTRLEAAGVGEADTGG